FHDVRLRRSQLHARTPDTGCKCAVRVAVTRKQQAQSGTSTRRLRKRPGGTAERQQGPARQQAFQEAASIDLHTMTSCYWLAGDFDTYSATFARDSSSISAARNAGIARLPCRTMNEIY